MRTKTRPEPREAAVAFWAKEDAAVEINIPLPAEERKLGRAINNLKAYVTSLARKRKLEVSERSLTHEERERFKPAKAKEVKSYIQHEIVEALPKNFKIPPERMVKMRWLLTWKPCEEEADGRRPKARLVILGFLDPDLTTQETHSPTLTRTTRQLMLQVAATYGMKLEKGDVAAAVLRAPQ